MCWDVVLVVPRLHGILSNVHRRPQFEKVGQALTLIFATRAAGQTLLVFLFVFYFSINKGLAVTFV